MLTREAANTVYRRRVGQVPLTPIGVPTQAINQVIPEPPADTVDPQQYQGRNYAAGGRDL